MRWVFLVAALLVAGCDTFTPPEVKDCEASLLRGLKSPSSYKRIKADSAEITKEIQDEIAKDAGVGLLPENDIPPPYVQVSIEYDADNSYGASLRDNYFCRYAVDAKGKAIPEKRLD